MKRDLLIGLAVGLVGLALVVAAIGLGYIPMPRFGAEGGRSSGLVKSALKVGGPFTLVDHTGKTVTDADFRGRYLLIYFGYTYCPDVCPTTLQTMTEALDLLGEKAEKVQPLFITVDPERDTVKVLADYVKAFHPRLVGLTGTADQIARAAKAYGVYYAKAEPSDPDAPYLMDHSSFVYLMGPDGRYLTVFPHGTTPEDMAATLKDVIDNRSAP